MPPEESETLIGRLMDHEATPQDLQRFEQLAGDESPLWRKLALDQLDMGLLAGRVRQETAVAERVDAVGPSGGRHLAIIFSGWAAVLVLGAWWAIAGLGDRTAGLPMPRLDPTATPERQTDLSPDEHLTAYLAAEFVGGELDPVLLETELIEPGRHRIWFVRRIEEFVDIDTPLEAVIDGSKFKVKPEVLRQ